MRTWILLRVGAFIAAALLSGCAADPPQPNANKRTLIASNPEWAVTAIGPVDRIFDPFFSFPHVEIRFEATRNGRVYAAGLLDQDDDPFDSNFPRREWVARNVLRMGRPQAREDPVAITVRHEGPLAAAWLTVESNWSTELFLILGLPARAEMRLQSKGVSGVRVTGAWEDGRPIKPVWWPRSDEKATVMQIVIREDGVFLDGTPGMGEVTVHRKPR